MKWRTLPSIKKYSIKTQLSFIFIVGIFLLATITSLSTTWRTNQQVRGILLKEGLNVAQSVANNSVLAILYNSEKNARQAVETALEFHSIKKIAIFDANLRPLVSNSVTQDNLPNATEITHVSTEPILSRETSEDWHFLAPIFLPKNISNEVDTPSSAEDTVSKPLGYAHVIMTKSTLKDLRNITLINNLGIALIMALVLTMAMHFILKRFLRPLSELANTMERAKDNTGILYTGEKGPQETTIIANTFNIMIKAIMERDNKLRQHNLTLESVVALRTKELVHARDAALEASRYKSEFLTNVSHELRTPLQSIIGYTDILTETTEIEGHFEYTDDLNRISQNATHLLSLINTILDLSKIEAGHMTLYIEETDPQQILHQVADTVRPLLQANQNDLETSIREIDSPLRIDAGKLLQILLNIVNNAAKFTHAGKITVNLNHTIDMLSIRISDNGIGISHEKLALIFEPFRQIDGSTTRKFQGTGLGLSISKHFCEMMGGTITVDSTLKQGTNFTINIPLPINETSDEINND